MHPQGSIADKAARQHWNTYLDHFCAIIKQQISQPRFSFRNFLAEGKKHQPWMQWSQAVQAALVEFLDMKGPLAKQNMARGTRHLKAWTREKSPCSTFFCAAPWREVRCHLPQHRGSFIGVPEFTFYTPVASHPKSVATSLRSTTTPLASPTPISILSRPTRIQL